MDAPTESAPARARLTIDELQRYVRVGANNAWVRWWAHWNYPQAPSQMAISLMDETGRTVECRDLESKGFEKVVNPRGFIVYVCDRIEKDGQPFVSRM